MNNQKYDEMDRAFGALADEAVIRESRSFIDYFFREIKKGEERIRLLEDPETQHRDNQND